MEFIDGNRVAIDPPKRPKLLTGTRLGAVLGMSKWATDFEVWCNVTRTWEDPFVESQYTLAGKVIEPKVAEYLRSHYLMTDIESPTDVFGPDYFHKTYGNFFDDPIFGGMWDFRGPDYVVEVKTTKRVEDWLGADGEPEPPEHYALQAALYAHLLGVDRVIMPCVILTERDYPTQRPDGSWDTAATDALELGPDNTIVCEFSMAERYPHFDDDYLVPARDWWHDHVETGVSPAYGRRDAEIVNELRKHTMIVSDEDMCQRIIEAEELQAVVDAADARVAEARKRLKELDGLLKDYMSTGIDEDHDRAEVAGSRTCWTLSRGSRESIDAKRLKARWPEAYEDCLKVSTTLTLRKRGIE